MNHPLILMAHVLFGVLCLVGSLWVFVDTLSARAGTVARIRTVSVAVAAAMWVAYLAAGYWYIDFYSADKALILKGPWPWAHDVVMETKEHLVIMLLLLATYLPIAARGRLASSRSARAGEITESCGWRVGRAVWGCETKPENAHPQPTEGKSPRRGTFHNGNLPFRAGADAA